MTCSVRAMVFLYCVALHFVAATFTGTFKRVWSKAEDALLKKLVAKFGAQEWSMLAVQLPGRCGKQCRERWFNHLSPNVRAPFPGVASRGRAGCYT